MIGLAGLKPGCFFWAVSRKVGGQTPEVVRISTEFGQEREFWTVLVTGSDQHHMPDDFEFIVEVALSTWSRFRDAAE
ncbi:hypothetical protein QA644_25035 (plasmid) [Rhizobium sp. CC1099]|uniref:hypothetical protein n=1 Tax=Rhizobium sp. CC1099 TaxID=3039160 RepID=UPI0024B2390E|nr:hypothetical protein [Rhizobium sp. CC1099]WFU91424.1 hypothetical protein QA644_25035 [Rhizobium sp. CC1099]